MATTLAQGASLDALDGGNVADVFLPEQPEPGDGVPDLDRVRVLGGDGLEGLTAELHSGQLHGAAVDIVLITNLVGTNGPGSCVLFDDLEQGVEVQRVEGRC